MRMLMCAGPSSAAIGTVLIAGAVMTAPAAGQYCAEDAFSVSTGPAGLTILHREAEYNCCVLPFQYTVQQTATQILVTETEVLDGGGCDCMCCYEISATFQELAGGTYELVVSYGTSEYRQMVEILGFPGGPPFVGPVMSSECGQTGVAPERTWSGIKATYR